MQIKFHSGELFDNTLEDWVTRESGRDGTRCQPTLKNHPFTLEMGEGLHNFTTGLWNYKVLYKLNAIPVWTISSNPTNALLTFCVDLQFLILNPLYFTSRHGHHLITWRDSNVLWLVWLNADWE